MTQRKEVSADLDSFLRHDVGIPNKAILPAHEIEDDFGITGDDANLMMENFFEKFSVGRGDYDFHRYFEIEASGFPIPFLDRWIRGKILGDRQYEKRPLTVAMLQHAIDLGVWNHARLTEPETPRPPA